MNRDLFQTNWIWVPGWTPEDDADVRIVYFRKEFTIGEGKKPDSNKIRISADSRYKLYLNGSFVQEGPQKALGLKEWYVDTAEIAPFLQEGANVAAVEVMRFPAPNFSNSKPRTNDSLYRTEIPNLYVEDLNADPNPMAPIDPDKVTLRGKSGWKCIINRDIRIFGEEARPAPIHVQEDVHASAAFAGWKEAGYDDSGWLAAAPRMFFDISMADAPGNLIPRTIPAQRHTEKQFEKTVCFRDASKIQRETDPAILAAAKSAGYSDAEAQAAATKEVGVPPVLADAEEMRAAWDALLHNGSVPDTASVQSETDNNSASFLTVPANTTQIVEISAGAEECGYLEYSFVGGKGAKVDTLCSEAYAYPAKPDPKYGQIGAVQNPVKGDRTDYQNGKLFGSTSHYVVAGYGTAARTEDYEPYWFRTFRYIQLRITTGEEPLTIRRFAYRETGYPLEVKTSFEVSDPDYKPIWDISVRTLERCMHETYFDCPFYEQLQYAMDGRSEALYTYAISGDDRLGRQAMEAFRLSQRPDGMTNSDAPTVKSNVIPAFSIYYLLMVHDHMMYFGDKELVRYHLPAIDQILSFFDRNLMENGMVGKVGGPIMRAKYWSFIDWSKKWNDNAGVPTATSKGSGALTMESLLYLYGLQNAAEMASFVGRDGLAAAYRSRAELLAAAIRKEAFGTYTSPDGTATKLLQDGPGIDEYSVHCQVFGILTGLVSAEDGRKMLSATVGNPELPQSSVSFMIYLFQAYELVDDFEKTDAQWNLWRRMLQNHLTTCVENDTDERSDCHGWASLMCYELPSAVLGVKPAAPGFAKIAVKPQMGKLDWAKGDVITPRGLVHVEWKKQQDGTCDLKYHLPE